MVYGSFSKQHSLSTHYVPKNTFWETLKTTKQDMNPEIYFNGTRWKQICVSCFWRVYKYVNSIHLKSTRIYICACVCVYIHVPWHTYLWKSTLGSQFSPPCLSQGSHYGLQARHQVSYPLSLSHQPPKLHFQKENQSDYTKNNSDPHLSFIGVPR